MINRIDNKENPSICLESCLLVASPAARPDLAGSVCLIVHHSGKGAVGVFLNRGLQAEAPELLKHLDANSQPADRGLLHCGGPNSGPVVALHNCAKLAEFTSAAGVYFAAQLDNLKELLRSESHNCAVKIIVGQADWSAGQLEQEFEAGNWIPLPVSPELVFADGHTMWAKAMREIGNQYVSAMTRAKVPFHILAN